MSDELEAKQEELDGANSQVATDANPDEGRVEGEEGTSRESGLPSPEEWAEYKTKLDQIPNLVSGMNKAQERAALLEQERDFYQRQAQSAAGVIQQAADPQAAALSELQGRLSQTYDEGERAQAYADYNRKILQLEKQSWLTEAEQRAQLQSSLPRAAQMLGADTQQATAHLANVLNTLTPEELALVKLKRDGRLDSHLEAERKQREQAARQAQLLQSGGLGGGRNVPGSAASGGGKWAAWEDWALVSDDEKVRLAEADEQITIVGAPPQYKASDEIARIKRKQGK